MPIASDLYYQINASTHHDRMDLLLIHGAGGNLLIWPPNIRRLSGNRVFSIDLPGHGKSKGHGFQSIKQYSDAVKNWINQLGLKNIIIIGHSMGSAISMTIALENPELVSGLVLIGSGAIFTVSKKLLAATQNPVTHPSAIQMIMNWSFSLKTPDKLIKLVQKSMLEIRPSILRCDLIACSHFDLRCHLQNLNCPTLIICGTEDRMTPLQQSKLLASMIPYSILEVIDEGGHMIMLEKPTRVAKLILDFIHNLNMNK